MMKPRKRIVVTTDFSEASSAVWPQALWLARRYEVPIEIVHVVAQDWTHLVPEATGAAMPTRLDWLLDGAKAQLEMWMPDVEGVDVIRTAIENPSTVRGIVEHLEVNPADVLMIGTHGRGFLGRLVLGSVARRVIAESPVPVWCMHASKGLPSTFGTPKRVLLATDFSETSREALRRAIAFAREFGAEVTVAHSIHVELPPLLDTEGVSSFATDRDLEARLMERLDDFVTKTGVENPQSIELAVLEGRPGDTLARLAREQDDIGLIALARRGAHHHPFGVGSTVDRLLHETMVPVLLF